MQTTERLEEMWRRFHDGVVLQDVRELFALQSGCQAEGQAKIYEGQL
jgi:hypothetical protein